MTTANLIVGIKTEPARAALTELKSWMVSEMKGLTVGINDTAIVNSVKKALASTQFTIKLDTKALGDEVHTALGKAFDHQHHVRINAEALTADVKKAVAAGGVVQISGASGGTGHTSGLDDLKEVMRQTLTPAVDKLSRAAIAVEGAARKIGTGTTSTGGLQASESLSRTDPETGVRKSVRRRLDDPVGTEGEIKTGLAADQGDLREKQRRDFMVAEARAQRRDEALNESGERAEQVRQRLSDARREVQEMRKVYNSARFGAREDFTPRGQQIAGAAAVVQRFPDRAAAFLNNDALIQAIPQLNEHRKATDASGAAVANHRKQTAEARAEQVRFNAVMNDTHSAARGLAGSMSALWLTYGSIVPLVALAAIGSGLRGVYEEGKKVEYQLAFVKGLAGASVSQKELEGAMAGSMISSPTQGAEGLRALAQSGLNAREALAALPAVLSLATVGETSVADAAYAATGVLKAFGLGIGEIGRVSDVMAKAAAVSNASVSDMLVSFKYGAAASAQYGVSLEETGAAYAVLAEKNIKGSMAGTTHMNLLREIYTPTKKASEAFKSLGIDLEAMQRKGLSSIEILDEIRKKTVLLDSTSLRKFSAEVGGKQGSRELSSALEGGTTSYKGMETKLQNSKGFIKSVMLELQDTVEGSSARMKQSLGFAFSGIFEDGKGSIQAFQDKLATVFSGSGFKGFLESAAQGVINLTRFLFDHAEVIKVVAFGYLGLKVITSLSVMLSEFARQTVVGSQALTVKAASLSLTTQKALLYVGAIDAAGLAEATQARATAAAALAQGTKTTAMTAAAGSTTANTLLTQANTTAQVGSAGALAAAATMTRALSGALSFIAGPIGIVIGVVTTLVGLWQLFVSRQGAARDAQDQYTNSVANTNRMLDQEIERLRIKERLRNSPGKNEKQVTIERNVEDQRDYIRQIEAAKAESANLVYTGKGFKQAGSDQVSSAPKFPLTDGEGKTILLTLKELGERVERLPDDKKALALSVKKLEEFNTRTNKEDAFDARASLKQWLEQKVKTLEDRKASGGNVGNAIEVLQSEMKDETLAGVTDMKQVERIEKALQKTADAGGTVYVTPTNSNKANALARSEELAESRKLIAQLEIEQRKQAQAFKYRKELEQAKFDPGLYGPYVVALLAEERQLEETTEAIKAQRKASIDLEALKKKPHLTVADQTDLDTRREKSGARSDELRLQLDHETKMTQVQKENRERSLKNRDTKDFAKLGVEADSDIKKLRESYSNKAIDKTEAAGNASALQVTLRYSQAIAVQEERTAVANESLATTRSRMNELTPEQYKVAVKGGEEQLAVETAVLAVLKAQSSAKAEVARRVGKDEFENSQTAQYGWDKFWNEYRSSGESNALAVHDIMKKTTGSMTDMVTTFATTGKGSFKSFAASVAAEATKIMMTRAIVQLLGLAANMFGASPGVAGGVNGSAGSGLGAGAGGVAPVLAANGAVMTSMGAVSLNRFASGGVARSPMMSIFGEGRQPEAYVPLPDGRSIPVTMKGNDGGGNTSVQIHVSVASDGGSQVNSDSSGKKAEQLGSLLSDQALRVIEEQKRPGGLLYGPQYA